MLGDAIAAFALPNDPNRQTLVWVDDFTPDEAVTYLDGRGCMLPAHDKANAQRRRELLKLGGTRPALLRKVCDILPASREAHLSALVSSATVDIEGLLWDGRTFSSDFGRLMCVPCSTRLTSTESQPLPHVNTSHRRQLSSSPSSAITPWCTTCPPAPTASTRQLTGKLLAQC